MSIFPTKILLATDGSEEAALAARTAADIAEKTHSELHVVYVGSSLEYVGMGPPQIADIPAPAQEQLSAEARELLDAEVEQVKAAGGTVAQAHLGVGAPTREGRSPPLLQSPAPLLFLPIGGPVFAFLRFDSLSRIISGHQ